MNFNTLQINTVESHLEGRIAAVSQRRNAEQNINRIDKNITSIDKEIDARKQYIVLLKESKEIDREIINIHENTINKLQALLDRNSNKIDVSDVKDNSLIVTESTKLSLIHI